MTVTSSSPEDTDALGYRIGKALQPGSVLALIGPLGAGKTTHVKGIGTFINGVEKPRANIVLATAISPERCKKVNLDYMNPDDINRADYENREDEGILLVHHAGEILHRLSSGWIPRIPK